MALKIGHAARALAGENECGDCCGYWESPERLVLTVADGLGHGPEAAYAAQAAIASIGDNLDRSCDEIFSRCDKRLRDTRGAAMAVAIIERSSNFMTLGVVGNIRAQLLTSTADLRYSGTRGIVGGGYARLIPEKRTLEQGDVLALFSDGVDEFARIRAIAQNDALDQRMQAETVLAQWASNNDDAAVLLYRHE